ncbi:alpha/beta-hydrolase [Thozetella sp. PMI_491]|nr:alpha/beta-hydrolase [Thozetella sp. PMI_491]
MAALTHLRAVYKVLDGQEIDARVYVPKPQDNKRAKCPAIINIHGGAFMLGSAGMVNKDQIQDCLSRGWVVVVPNHRLCPQVDLLDGPMRDSRDLLAWIQDGSLEQFISKEVEAPCQVDTDFIFAFGTSSGGHLSLCLGFDVPRPVAGIYDMYGPCSFADPFWTSELPHVKLKLPEGLTPEFLNQVYSEKPVPIEGGVSLEGQAPGPPNFSEPRQAFAFTQIAGGTVMDAIFPSKEWQKVDPLRNITAQFPPTFIVHGQSDTMVPIGLSRQLYASLQKNGVNCGMREVPGEEHTFAARMKVGSATWELQREGFDFLERLLPPQT